MVSNGALQLLLVPSLSSVLPLPRMIHVIIFKCCHTYKNCRGGSGLLSVFGLNEYGQVVWGRYNSVSLQWSFSSAGSEQFLA